MHECDRHVALEVDMLDQVVNHHYWLKRYIEMSSYMTQKLTSFYRKIDSGFALYQGL